MSKTHKNYALKLMVLWYYFSIDFLRQNYYNPSLPLVNAKWSLLLAPFPCMYADFPVFMRVENF